MQAEDVPSRPNIASTCGVLLKHLVPKEGHPNKPPPPRPRVFFRHCPPRSTRLAGTDTEKSLTTPTHQRTG